jgi:uncharacterized protein YdhG (YjbR/CyaY superfamily)
MPAFEQGEKLVYFAVAKNHYGFYPTSRHIEVFKKQKKVFNITKIKINNQNFLLKSE